MRTSRFTDEQIIGIVREWTDPLSLDGGGLGSGGLAGVDLLEVRRAQVPERGV